jgi:quinol monooxygenase YgiN
MAKKNPHIGSSFESWLDREGIRAEVTSAAIKAVIARAPKGMSEESRATSRESDSES